MATDAATDQNEEQATTELVTGAVGSRCANCHAPLANDQRYCLNCGARRGKPTLPSTPVGAAAPAAATVEHRTHPRPRMSSAATLVAGVATLLIALGVGVLIGHYSATPATQKSAGVQVLTVGGGGSSAAVNPSAPAQQPTAAATHRTATKKQKTVVVHLTPKLQQKAAQAASKVFGTGGNGNLSSNPTQQVGASCSGGAGCQNGTFTGNFFH